MGDEIKQLTGHDVQQGMRRKGQGKWKKEGDKERKSEEKSQTSSQTDQTDLYCSQSRFFPPLCVTCLPHLVTLSLAFPSFCMTFSHTNSFPSLHFFLSLFPLIGGINCWDLCPVASGFPLIHSLIHSHSHWKGFPGSDPSLFPSFSPLSLFSLPLQVFFLALFLSFTTWGGNRTPVTGDQKEVPLPSSLRREREERNRKRNNSRMCHGKRGSEKVG